MHDVIIQNIVLNFQIQWHDILTKPVSFFAQHHTLMTSTVQKPLLDKMFLQQEFLGVILIFVPSFLSPNDPSGRHISGDKNLVPLRGQFH